MIEDQLIEALLSGKPYFGPAMRAIQGPPVRHRYLTALATEIAQWKQQVSIRILEIGTWAGASAITWATAIQKLGREGKVTCVDQWQPYFVEQLEVAPHYRAMNQAAKDDKIFKLFLHNIRAAKVSHMIDYLVGDANKVLPELPSDSFDIIYIDGSHVYENVRADIKQAKRLIREGGIICGDDLELEGMEVDEREHAAAVDSKRDFVYSTKRGGYYHPGVTEAVAVEFGTVSNWEGVWAARKVGQQWTRVEVDVEGVQIPDHVENGYAAVEPTEVGQTAEYWLLKDGKKFIAMAKSLGSTSDLVERLRERQLSPVLFAGDDLEELRETALMAEKQATAPDVQLVGEFGGYNLVRAGDRFLAAAKDLGPIDLFRERIGEREFPPLLLLAGDVVALRQRIAALTAKLPQQKGGS
jgi:predicted O-methyltransferase YrrM